MKRSRNDPCTAPSLASVQTVDLEQLADGLELSSRVRDSVLEIISEWDDAPSPSPLSDTATTNGHTTGLWTSLRRLWGAVMPSEHKPQPKQPHLPSPVLPSRIPRSTRLSPPRDSNTAVKARNIPVKTGNHTAKARQIPAKTANYPSRTHRKRTVLKPFGTTITNKRNTPSLKKPPTDPFFTPNPQSRLSPITITHPTVSNQPTSFNKSTPQFQQSPTSISPKLFSKTTPPTSSYNRLGRAQTSPVRLQPVSRNLQFSSPVSSAASPAAQVRRSPVRPDRLRNGFNPSATSPVLPSSRLPAHLNSRTRIPRRSFSSTSTSGRRTPLKREIAPMNSLLKHITALSLSDAITTPHTPPHPSKLPLDEFFDADMDESSIPAHAFPTDDDISRLRLSINKQPSTPEKQQRSTLPKTRRRPSPPRRMPAARSAMRAAKAAVQDFERRASLRRRITGDIRVDRRLAHLRLLQSQLRARRQTLPPPPGTEQQYTGALDTLRERKRQALIEQQRRMSDSWRVPTLGDVPRNVRLPPLRRIPGRDKERPSISSPTDVRKTSFMNVNRLMSQ